MTQFSADNTEGFDAAELAAMNDEFHRALALELGALPNGGAGADDDLVLQIKQSTAEAVLRQHGAA